MTENKNTETRRVEARSAESGSSEMEVTVRTSTDTKREPSHAPDDRCMEGRGYTVGGFIMAVLAVLVIPPIHGLIGGVLGYIGHRKGDSLGRTAMVCSLAAMVVGSMVAALAFRSVA
ncbi:MAG: hypothetical protein M3N28_00095 [Actinomycetota bacterium]|nr:hypothetical protein [Actinomycetota bacterium]